MKYAKVLSLSLIALTLIGCNKPPVDNDANNEIESNLSQKQDSVSTATTDKVDNTPPTNSPAVIQPDKTSPKISTSQKNQQKSGKQIGAAFDCDGDGQADDARIDYDGDGIPDDCVVYDGKAAAIIDETSFQTVSKSLESITKGCTKTKKTEDNLQFEICKKGNRVVSATEYAPEADAGSTYWFSPDDKLIAMRYFSSGDTYVFDSNYKISSKFNVYKSSKVNKITADERNRIEEDSYFSYRRILDVFNL